MPSSSRSASVGSSTWNSVISCSLVPVSRCTPAALPGRDRVERRLRAARRRRRPAATAARRRRRRPRSLSVGLRGEQLRRPAAPAAPRCRRAHAELLERALARSSAARSRVLTHAPAPLCAIALWNSPRAAGSAEQRADAVRAGRLAEDRHVVGVAAERRRCCRAPTRARRPGRGCPRCPSRRASAPNVVGEVQEAERAEPVVDRDDDDVAVLREVRAVVPRHRARAEDVRAAVDPHHHRPARVVARGRPHVEVEAVFARRRPRARRASRAIGEVGLRDLGPRTRSRRARRPTALRARGGRKRRGPTGGAANGMPRNTSTPSCSTPSIFPLRVAAIVMAAQVYGPVQSCGSRARASRGTR